MHAHSRRDRQWRRFSHKRGVPVLVGMAVAVVVAVVGLLMYLLTSMSCRVR